MIEFQGKKYMLGELVAVEVTGIVDGLTDSGSLRISYHGLSGERYILVSESPSVQAARRIPAQGAPKAGEIWRDAEDRQWFAFANGMRCADNDTGLQDTGLQATSFVNEQYGPLVRVYPEGGK